MKQWVSFYCHSERILRHSERSEESTATKFTLPEKVLSNRYFATLSTTIWGHGERIHCHSERSEESIATEFTLSTIAPGKGPSLRSGRRGKEVLLILQLLSFFLRRFKGFVDKVKGAKKSKN